MNMHWKMFPKEWFLGKLVKRVEPSKNAIKQHDICKFWLTCKLQGVICKL